MSSAAKKTFITSEEYLARERLAEFKSEYYDGQIYAMAGTSYRHSTIVMNLSGELYTQLRGRPCRPCVSDVRLRTKAADAYCYPDIMVICGEPQFAEAGFDTLLNPTVIIEVLSPQTEAWDRGGTFHYYQKIASLKEYTLVSQNRVVPEDY